MQFRYSITPGQLTFNFLPNMIKTLLPACLLLLACQNSRVNAMQISVWKASLLSIKKKYCKMVKRKSAKIHHQENIEQCKELITFLNDLEKVLE